MLIKVNANHNDYLVNTDHILFIRKMEELDPANSEIMMSNGHSLVVEEELSNIHLAIQKPKKIYHTVDRLPPDLPPPDYGVPYIKKK